MYIRGPHWEYSTAFPDHLVIDFLPLCCAILGLRLGDLLHTNSLMVSTILPDAFLSSFPSCLELHWSTGHTYVFLHQQTLEIQADINIV